MDSVQEAKLAQAVCGELAEHRLGATWHEESPRAVLKGIRAGAGAGAGAGRDMSETREISWPRHKAGMLLRHDYNKGAYQSIEEYIGTLCAAQEVGGLDIYDEASFPLLERRLCVERDTIWELVWYPATSVGSCRVAAATFERCLELACDDE